MMYYQIRRVWSPRPCNGFKGDVRKMVNGETHHRTGEAETDSSFRIGQKRKDNIPYITRNIIRKTSHLCFLRIQRFMYYITVGGTLLLTVHYCRRYITVGGDAIFYVPFYDYGSCFYVCDGFHPRYKTWLHMELGA